MKILEGNSLQYASMIVQQLLEWLESIFASGHLNTPFHVKVLKSQQQNVLRQ